MRSCLLLQAPKKVQIIVSQMGISVMDAQGRPVTNILFMMLTKWEADPKGLLIEQKAKGDKDIRFRTGTVTSACVPCVPCVYLETTGQRLSLQCPSLTPMFPL